ncbi:type IV pili methyl-accepting chemotaxis transducer N-terminal domain-containing protein [Maribacter sp. 4U21]|uniref:type IV pili methyl-accepting chemotaxis transducer N-terminal domain-containing protein n=1 Tax=Maribacter sp. 4U21 TaxID=1889779 RepID=UPI00211F3191|nr:type IV pili methyl-accepting chemotaxis transducer N-terminal domain-containing protein [Maribacter sp. 4U21]
MANSKHKKPLDTTTFQRILKWYLLALAGIALTIIVAQILIQAHLNSQLNDSRVIKIAGRQRAFSQKLVKEILLLKETNIPIDRQQIISEIEKTLMVWKASHHGLQSEDRKMRLPVEKNTEILSLFEEIDPHHKAMVGAIETILSQKGQTEDFEKQKTILLENERTFLWMMDNIVNKYGAHSNAQLQNLKKKNIGFLLFHF